MLLFTAVEVNTIRAWCNVTEHSRLRVRDRVYTHTALGISEINRPYRTED